MPLATIASGPDSRLISLERVPVNVSSPPARTSPEKDLLAGYRPMPVEARRQERLTLLERDNQQMRRRLELVNDEMQRTKIEADAMR